MAKIDFKAKLLKLDGAVKPEDKRDIHANVLESSSPSLNFCFGKGWGLPRGYSLMLYGPPRGGKSIIANDIIGRLHANDPTAFAIKFNTEFREEGQADDTALKMFGIDESRYIPYQVNQPDQIYDRIARDFQAMVQDGMNLGLVIIDSLTGVVGRRAMNADTIMTQQMGDNALTNQEGLKYILQAQRKCNFGLIVTTHVRAEMDQWAAKRAGRNVKAAASYGVLHHCEYYMFVEENKTADARVDAEGNEFRNKELTDFAGKAEKTGHKIRVHMTDSSLGPKDRHGEFTFDYARGVVNQHEEVLQLAIDRGIITRPNNTMYEYGGLSWRGFDAVLQVVKGDPALQANLLRDLKKLDL